MGKMNTRACRYAMTARGADCGSFGGGIEYLSSKRGVCGRRLRNASQAPDLKEPPGTPVVPQAIVRTSERRQQKCHA